MFWATLCAALILAVQGVYSYRHVHDDFERALREIGQTHVALLSVVVWDIEREAVRRQIDAIARRPEIGYVRLKVATGQLFVAGDEKLLRGGRVHGFDVPPPARFGTPIARLEIVEDPAALYRELVLSIGSALFGYALLTLLICILIVLVLKRKLEQPLHEIAQFAGALAPDRLTTPLRLKRSSKHPRDEIDLVAEAFAALQGGILGHIRNLDAQVAQRTAELQAALESIRQLSNIDPLTGCYNRRMFDQRIRKETERAQRYARPLSIAFCDIDHFKQVNDSYGHLTGDTVLQTVAQEIRSGLRNDIDWVARFGGEEFILVLPETDLPSAIATAERIRRALMEKSIAHDAGELTITASFGVAQLLDQDSIPGLIHRADSALYQAKQAGRNRTYPLL